MNTYLLKRVDWSKKSRANLPVQNFLWVNRQFDPKLNAFAEKVRV